MSTLALVRRRTGVWGILAALAAVVTGIGVYSYLSYLRAQVPIAGSLVPVVVASQDVDPGTVLDAGLVELSDHPEKYLPQGSLNKISLAIGKVTTVPIFAGEPIVERKLGAAGGLSSVVPPGQRAFSLAVSSGALGFSPKPGDRVDVVVTFPREVLGEATTLTVLRGKQIATVGASRTASSGKVARQLGLNSEQREGMGLTLFVTPEEAQKLALAETMGKITVVLSPQDASDDNFPKPVRPADLGR